MRKGKNRKGKVKGIRNWRGRKRERKSKNEMGFNFTQVPPPFF